MAKHKEIEVKWCADKVSRKDFNRKLKSLLKSMGCSVRFLRVKGPDTYYANKHRDVVRHRLSPNTHELTIKLRLSNKSIRTRKEVNVKLDLDQPVEDVIEFLRCLGLKHTIRLVKDCDIYFVVTTSGSHASIVWYEVEDEAGGLKRFMEVEIEGQSRHRSLVMLDFWCKRIEKLFPISRRDRSPDSLYELYTGKRYAKAKRI